MKNFLKYFAWTIAIGAIFFIGLTYQKHIIQTGMYSFNMYPAIIYTITFPIVMGMLLRLPKWLTESKNNATWKVNWPKLLAVGIPTLFITLVPLLYFTESAAKIPFMAHFIHLNDTTIPGLILGYIILDSIKKEN
ncbi:MULTISPECIES: hypothetical protein [Bacillus]|uniref:hypothetical protein n=1 Tax=Bacillus TaxID=1386 RepID=UPI000BB691B3|nr:MULTISPECIES: hypothetical protein [Bacillus]